MKTLKEAIQAVAKQAVEFKGYEGTDDRESEILADLVYAKVSEHLAQYNPKETR
jgi:hypothetical protein